MCRAAYPVCCASPRNNKQASFGPGRGPSPSPKQVPLYRKQADQLLLACGAQDKRDAMYEQERRETMIGAADDVACAA